MLQTTALDPRVRRTRQRLQEALLALAADRDFASITVHDITRRADVNRATFYQHYRDRDDLVAQTIDALIAEITAACNAFLETHTPLSPDFVPPSVVSMFREVGRRADLYRRLLGDSGSTSFSARFQANGERLFLRSWEDLHRSLEEADAPPEVRARFAAAATQGLVSWWLDCGQGISAESMAAWLWQLLGPAWFSTNDRLVSSCRQHAGSADRSH